MRKGEPGGHSGDITIETVAQKKARLDTLFASSEAVERDSELMSLFDRKKRFASTKSPDALLRAHGYPPRTKIAALRLDPARTALNQKFVKDGHIYLLRGDYPHSDEKGFYARTYGYGKLSTAQLATRLHGPDEVGYALYDDERFLTITKPLSKSVLEELALLQSVRGGSSFISLTTSIISAEAGTGNQPDREEQRTYQIYVARVPVEVAMRGLVGDAFVLEEDEYLVPDYVAKEEILAAFPRTDKEQIYEYLRKQLNIAREDVRL